MKRREEYREQWAVEQGRRRRRYVVRTVAWWHTPFTMVFLVGMCALLCLLLVLQDGWFDGPEGRRWFWQTFAWFSSIALVAILSGKLYEKMTAWFGRQLAQRVARQHALVTDSETARCLTGRVRKLSEGDGAVVSARCSLRKEQYIIDQMTDERFLVECDDGDHLIEADYLRVGGPPPEQAHTIAIRQDDIVTVQGFVRDKGPFRGSARHVLYGTEAEPVRLVVVNDELAEAPQKDGPPSP